MHTIIQEKILQSNNIAILDNKGNKVTYKKLAEDAKELAQYIEQRSLIFILCDYHIETVKFLYEILYLNRVPLLLSKDIDIELLENLIAIYKPQYIYCKKIYELHNKYHSNIEFQEHILLKTNNNKYPIHSDVALLLSTSGTTGSAKLVKLSYNNLYNNSEYTCLHLGIQQNQKGLSPLALNYAYGFAFCLWHWHCGATLLITEEMVFSSKFQEFYIREQVNNFAATPYTYQMLQKIQFWDSEKIKYLHFAVSGGAQLSEQAQKQLVSIMKDKFWILYGQTECTCVISGMNFEENNIKLGSIGKVFNNINATLDKNTKELIIQSNSVCMGYANNKEQLVDGDINQGILHTGDVAYIDEEGCIYLKGRLQRYIKVNEKRICLDDIESYLKSKYNDIEFACIGTDNNIIIFCTSTKEDIIQKVSILLDCHMQIPHKFISCFAIEKIPRNDSGKVLYAKLENMELPEKKIS